MRYMYIIFHISMYTELAVSVLDGVTCVDILTLPEWSSAICERHTLSVFCAQFTLEDVYSLPYKSDSRCAFICSEVFVW